MSSILWDLDRGLGSSSRCGPKPKPSCGDGAGRGESDDIVGGLQGTVVLEFGEKGALGEYGVAVWRFDETVRFLLEEG